MAAAVVGVRTTGERYQLALTSRSRDIAIDEADLAAVDLGALATLPNLRKVCT